MASASGIRTTMSETENETETEALTRKDWILFFLVVAFFAFIAIALFIIVTNPPKPQELMQPMTTLLRTLH